MKKNNLCAVLLAAVVLCVSGCVGSSYTVTDNVTLYPKNNEARQWGVLKFYTQPSSNTMANKVVIDLPTGQMLSGLMTYTEKSDASPTAISKSKTSSFWDDVQLSFGTVGGNSRSHGGFIGDSHSASTTSINRLRKGSSAVSIAAFGDGLSISCQGNFEHRQRTGTLSCEVSNRMLYQGTISRMIMR